MARKRKNKRRKQLVHVKLRRDLHERLCGLAQFNGVTATMVVHVALEAYFKSLTLEPGEVASDDRTPLKVLSDASAERAIREHSMGARS